MCSLSPGSSPLQQLDKRSRGWGETGDVQGTPAVSVAQENHRGRGPAALCGSS